MPKRNGKETHASSLDGMLGAMEGRAYRALGGAFATSFYITFKNLQLYSANNINVRQTLGQVMANTVALLEESDDLRLSAARNYLFVNDVRLRSGRGGFQNFGLLYTEMIRRGVGAIVLHHGIIEEEIENLLMIMNEAPNGEEADGSYIQDRVQELGISTIDVETYVDGEMEVDLEDIAEEARRASINAYFRAIFLMRDIYKEVREDKKLNVRILKRVVQNMVDIVAAGDYTLMALTRVKNYVSYLVNHAVNVCVLSIWLGNELGLGKVAQEQLGLSSLFADIGMACIPEEIAEGKEKLSDEEWAQVRRHPLIGSRILLRSGRISEVTIRSMLVAFQHHTHADYPELVPLDRTDIFSRIVTITDAFDAMTTPRPFRQTPMSPEEALNSLSDDEGGRYDPLLIKLFVNTIG
ncbi:MAG: hypothetical protein O6952_08850, partial [Planctomycetota bacterium]|nr:hypothetical protein [Planctomycetota bacterium]